MYKQLEFVLVTKDDGIVVAASYLVNSAHWNGELNYFPDEGSIIYDDNIANNNVALKYPLPASVCDGVLLSDSELKILVGSDSGWLSIYSLGSREEFDHDDAVISRGSVLNNDISRVEHEHCILSVSVTGRNTINQKAVTGGMDCSIVVWDVENFVPEVTYDAAHVHHVTSVRFIDGDHREDAENLCHGLFASASLDGYCLLWDKRKKFPAEVLYRRGNCGLTSLEWLKKSANKLVLGCEDGYVVSVDIRNPKEPLYSLSLFQEAVHRISSYSCDSQNYIAVGGNCRTLKVLRCDSDCFFDLYTSDKHCDYVRGLAWTNKNDELLACAWDSKITKHSPFKS